MSELTTKEICGLCGGNKIITDYDVGWDVFEGGEERQHVDRCRDCGAWRWHFKRIIYPNKTETFLGKWRRKEEWLIGGFMR